MRFWMELKQRLDWLSLSIGVVVAIVVIVLPLAVGRTVSVEPEQERQRYDEPQPTPAAVFRQNQVTHEGQQLSYQQQQAIRAQLARIEARVAKWNPPEAPRTIPETDVEGQWQSIQSRKVLTPKQRNSDPESSEE